MRKPATTGASEAGGVVGAVLTTIVVVMLFGFFGIGVYFLVRGMSQDSVGSAPSKRPVVRIKTPPAETNQPQPSSSPPRQPTPGISTSIRTTTPRPSQPSTSSTTATSSQPKPTVVAPRPVQSLGPPLSMAPGIALSTDNGPWFTQRIAEWIRLDRIQITEVNHRLVQRLEAMPPFYLDYDRVELSVHGSFSEVFEFIQVVETEIPLAVFRQLQITDTAELGIELFALVDLPRLLNPDRIPDRKQGEILRLAERVQDIRWVAPAPKNPFRTLDSSRFAQTKHSDGAYQPLTAELAEKHLVLSGIIGKGQGGMAILNEKIYRAGDFITLQINGMLYQAELLEILSPPARVKLQSGGKQFFVFAVVE